MGGHREGYQYKKGDYVVLSDEDFKRANVKATQTIDIAQFTDLADIPPEFFETPYYLAPGKGGGKVYALLREAMNKSKKLRSRQWSCANGSILSPSIRKARR